MHAVVVSNEKERKDAFSVRQHVFVEEQEVPLSLEQDAFDATATHLVLYEGEVPIGAGRIRSLEGYGKIERVCVLATARHQGAGRALMEAIEAAASRSHSSCKLNAQTHAARFYTKLGYEVVSEPFLDAGIPHVTMVKTLKNST
ncbi:GNAT family N-acetyltransferase [Shouchella shacheensis]|uniref:GNAT family N-acetyltransferase n=1 Tax=Shouchella shacheensis TaxID=1649580 RepID=UPI000740522A|nr:GNAT family N-acetyltransferase [Shouchella shacheensis]